MRTAFELRNVPNTFQRTVDATISAVKWQFALVYLDGIAFISRSAAEHIDNATHVLTLLRDAGATLKLMKYNLDTETIFYMGQAIRPGRSETASHARDAIN